jgi:hypothetical protein
MTYRTSVPTAINDLLVFHPKDKVNYRHVIISLITTSYSFCFSSSHVNFEAIVYHGETTRSCIPDNHVNPGSPIAIRYSREKMIITRVKKNTADFNPPESIDLKEAQHLRVSNKIISAPAFQNYAHSKVAIPTADFVSDTPTQKPNSHTKIEMLYFFETEHSIIIMEKMTLVFDKGLSGSACFLCIKVAMHLYCWV